MRASHVTQNRKTWWASWSMEIPISWPAKFCEFVLLFTATTETQRSLPLLVIVNGTATAGLKKKIFWSGMGRLVYCALRHTRALTPSRRSDQWTNQQPTTIKQSTYHDLICTKPPCAVHAPSITHIHIWTDVWKLYIHRYNCMWALPLLLVSNHNSNYAWGIIRFWMQ